MGCSRSTATAPFRDDKAEFPEYTFVRPVSIDRQPPAMPPVVPFNRDFNVTDTD